MIDIKAGVHLCLDSRQEGNAGSVPTRPLGFWWKRVTRVSVLDDFGHGSISQLGFGVRHDIPEASVRDFSFQKSRR